MKGTRLVNRFSEKKSYLGKWAILAPKMVHPHNSGSAVRFFSKFCAMKGANDTNNFFQKKKYLGQMDHFGPKNGRSSKLWICFKIFSLILHSEKGQ